MKFKKQYDVLESDTEEFFGDYLVDDSGYESLESLLERCIRDGRALPEHSSGLVDDFEADSDLELSDRVDQVLFPEDYAQVEQPGHGSLNNINEQPEAEKRSEAKQEANG